MKNRFRNYAKGYTLATANGTAESRLTISGIARKLLGIAFSPVTGVNVTWKVNNDTILDRVDVSLLSKDENTGLIFYPFPRELSGNDTVEISFNSVAASVEINYAIHYEGLNPETL